jgi:hypothetical protein
MKCLSRLFLIEILWKVQIMSVVRSARLDGILTSTSKELDELIITKEDEKKGKTANLVHDAWVTLDE